MLTESLRQLKTSCICLLIFTVLTGLIYPLFVTGIAQLFFPWRSNGSLLYQNKKPIGSVLIGQSFTSANYFWGRPSATPLYPYNAASSSGSNMGPSNLDFLEKVQERAKQLHQGSSHNHLVPVDLVTASGSGLDPEISPLAAFYQVSRVARENHLPEKDIVNLIKDSIKNRTLGLLGEPRVNVLKLNIALEKLRTAHGRAPTQSR